MFYDFPLIEKLDDVLPAIEGRAEFIVAEREGFTVVNYVVAMDDTFPPIKTAGGSAKMRAEQSRIKAIRRELRGIIFDKNGNILSRRLHKFFNVNEREETLVKNIDFSQDHVILEKLDGSMITPIMIDGVIRWGTKMGLTDVSKPVEEWVKDHPEYIKLVERCFWYNETPIFEWCSRKQRIVIDHPKDRLVLTAIRNNITGYYAPYNILQTEEDNDIEVVKSYPGTIESMEHLIEVTKPLEGVEGFVLRFGNGHMVKIKGEWYTRIHKIKDALTFEKNILDMIINEKIDDAKAFMLEEDRVRVEKFEHNFWTGLNSYISNLESCIEFYINMCKGSKKDFALTLAQNLDWLPKAVTFSVWDGNKNVREEVINIIKKNISTQTKVDNIRFVWDNHKWNYGEIE